VMQHKKNDIATTLHGLGADRREVESHSAWHFGDIQSEAQLGSHERIERRNKCPVELSSRQNPDELLLSLPEQIECD